MKFCSGVLFPLTAPFLMWPFCFPHSLFSPWAFPVDAQFSPPSCLDLLSLQVPPVSSSVCWHLLHYPVEPAAGVASMSALFDSFPKLQATLRYISPAVSCRSLAASPVACSGRDKNARIHSTLQLSREREEQDKKHTEPLGECVRVMSLVTSGADRCFHSELVKLSSEQLLFLKVFAEVANLRFPETGQNSPSARAHTHTPRISNRHFCSVSSPNTLRRGVMWSQVP